MVQGILGTDYGDTNLDGRFDSTDLILAFSAGQYEDASTANSVWSRGDYDCDGDFNSGDLILAFSTGGYVAAANRSAIAIYAAAIDEQPNSSDAMRLDHFDISLPDATQNVYRKDTQLSPPAAQSALIFASRDEYFAKRGTAAELNDSVISKIDESAWT
jgi:hypothetical protein